MSDDQSNGKGHLYPRVLLKISGESLMGKQAYGIDPEMVAAVAQPVSYTHLTLPTSDLV